VRGEPTLRDMELPDGMTLDRLKDRRRLVEMFDEEFRGQEAKRDLGNFPRQQRLAFEMLTSAKVREAFDLSREEDRARERYGRTLFGSSTLLARRLVERGVRFVNVSWDNFSKRFEVSKAGWDTHQSNFPMLRETLLPNFDQTYSAFIEDLDARGLLDETLVVTMGEMGRTPKINSNGGRDHWTYCYSVLLAGGGIRGGTIHGASDEQAAFIKDKPVHIREMPVYDRANRPVAVAHGGQPIKEILA
jgi:uncharacterized protein (DUF1501 family)